jgi:hypothetical protein
MKIFKSLSSDTFYKLISVLANGVLDISEGFLKQWLGTVIGGRFVKWFTDILVKRFADQLARPIIMLGVIRLGYYYDVHDAKNKIKKLENAEDANDEELYIRTLNDILRK